MAFRAAQGYFTSADFTASMLVSYRPLAIDMAVMGRGLSHALGDGQAMSMSIDDIGFSERG